MFIVHTYVCKNIICEHNEVYIDRMLDTKYNELIVCPTCGKEMIKCLSATPGYVKGTDNYTRC